MRSVGGIAVRRGRDNLGMRITRVLILFAAVVVLVPLGRAAERVPAAEPGKLIFVNVGQGDGVVIKLGQTVVVSDLGEHRSRMWTRRFGV